MDLFSVETALPALAEQINQEHTQAAAALQAGLLHARNAGELLLKAKASLHHGRWLPWLKDHCQFSQRTAQGYMRIAKEWATLEAKTQHVADLPLRDGLKLLAQEKADDAQQAIFDPSQPKRWMNMTPEDRHDLATQWWDIMAGYTLCFDAAGWEAEKIAESMGMPVADVLAILNPAPPVRFDHEANCAGVSPAFQQCYSNTVQGLIACWLGMAYLHASTHAEREGFSDSVQQDLQALSRYHWKRVKVLRKAGDLFDGEFPDSDTTAVFYLCALDDAREAVGIQRKRECLIIMLGEHLRRVKGNEQKHRRPAVQEVLMATDREMQK